MWKFIPLEQYSMRYECKGNTTLNHIMAWYVMFCKGMSDSMSNESVDD